MDLQAKRKLKEVIRGIVGEGFHGTQSEIAKSLKSRGFKVTQSTVSRTMNQMGVIKEVKGGKQSYRLSLEPKNSYRGSISDLVFNIVHNESLIVVKTKPGSAMFVAGFIDHESKASVIGTIAGDDTIFIAPMKLSKISQTLKEIEDLLTMA
jgi:transcriptional regulator of arginine metabolism